MGLHVSMTHMFLVFICCAARCRLSYYAVFDGHGGGRASKYAAQHLHKIIADKFPKGNVN